MRTLTAAALGALATLSIVAGGAATAQDDFYRGKTVAVVIGSKSGSLSVTALIVSRHLGRHIPGNPAVVHQQMPGGAHLVATNHVFNVAPADGLTILGANPQVAMAQLAKLGTVRFDVGRFEWLGSSGADSVLMGVRADLPYRSFKEIVAAQHELVVGSTGPGSNSHDFPLLLKEFAGLKVRFVTGYAANTDIYLALQRKEVDAWTALATTVKQAADQGIVRPIARARTPVAGLAGIPIDEDLATDPIGRSLMAMRGIPLAIGRPYAVRPGTPPERVAMLRQALARTIADAQFQAEMAKAGIEWEHIPADVVTKGFAELMGQPPAVLETMTKYIKVGE